MSNEQIIKASRDFVCIRTATYEDRQEAVFLKSTFLGRFGGELRNFGYCVLSPDGKQKLRRSDRGPNFVYANANEMAKDLRGIARKYPAKPITNLSSAPVPEMKSVRLGINVASCDGLPCIVVVGKDHNEVARMKQKLSDVIWDEELIGKFIYASTTERSDLKIVAGAKSKTGILVIEPDAYGMKGQLIKAIDADVSRDDLKQSLSYASDTFTRNSKSHGSHVRYGRRNGIIWKTEIPVSDPASRRRVNRSSKGERRRTRD